MSSSAEGLRALLGCASALTSVCAASCKPDAAAGSDCLRTPSAEIGSGELAFEPLADGADLTMEFGPQGGWHLLTSLRLSGVSDIARLHPTATAESLGLPIAGSQVPENRELTSCSPERCTCEALNLRVFLDVDNQAQICRLEGEPVEIVMEITDLTTNAAGEARRTVVAQLDTVDIEACHP